MSSAIRSASVTSIIIPTYNNRSLLNECIRAIRQHTHSPYEIIVVDDGSTDGTVDYCREAGLVFAALPHNSGFPHACNMGMLLATGDVIVLLNNDVIVSARWLENMRAALRENEDVGIVGPITNYASGKQQVVYDYDNLEQFHRIARAINEPDKSKRFRVQRIVGLCFVMRREVIERIGLLDERFSPGHYEDDDYCLRARISGFGIMICGDVLVHHYGSKSFREHGDSALKQLVQRNYNLFIDKWRIDPHQFI
ncbi:glycosyltransferase family 2 protein [Paenibacillus marinisediminis]